MNIEQVAPAGDYVALMHADDIHQYFDLFTVTVVLGVGDFCNLQLYLGFFLVTQAAQLIVLGPSLFCDPSIGQVAQLVIVLFVTQI